MAVEIDSLVRTLGLAPHPEGGFYREHYRTAASTAIYFLLPADTFSAFHVIAADEIWHHYAGAPLELHTIDHEGRARCEVLSDDSPVAVVPGGILQAARSLGAYSLMGCTVAPPFDFAKFEIPTRASLLARFSAHADLITRFSR